MVLKYKTKLSRCLWRRKKKSPSSKTLKSLKSQNKIFEDGEVYWRKETGGESTMESSYSRQKENTFPLGRMTEKKNTQSGNTPVSY